MRPINIEDMKQRLSQEELEQLMYLSAKLEGYNLDENLIFRILEHVERPKFQN